MAEQSGGRLDLTTYGTDDADVRVSALVIGDRGSRADLRTPAGDMTFETSLRGRYNVDNCLCAIGMSLHLAFARAAIVNGIRPVTPLPGRLQPTHSGRGFAVLAD